MIELQGITKSFGTLQVLKGIDLMIEKGEVVSIVGPSGAGKTTLLQIMGTLDKADTGTILLNGTEVSCLKEKELSAFRNRQIGFVFQFHQLLPEFTALENVMMPALIAGTSSSEAMRKAKETLAFLGLSERASHKPAELSGGEKQRVAVARALINNPAGRGKLLSRIFNRRCRMADNVNHPAHYETGKFECIEVMLETQGVEATKDFCVCNALKYIYRHRNKNGVEDIKKADWYLKKYLELAKSQEEKA